MKYIPGWLIAVGSGEAKVTRDGQVVYSESDALRDGQLWTFGKAAAMAKQRPQCRWEIILRAPLWNQLWRFDGSDWVLIERGEGFA